MGGSAAKKEAEALTLSYLTEVPKVCRKHRSLSCTETTPKLHEPVHGFGQTDEILSTNHSIDLRRLLWTLTIEFGGEARCVDLNGKIRDHFDLECTEEESLDNIRSEAEYLEGSQKVTLEKFDTGVLILRITPSGVALALGDSLAAR